MNLRKEYLALFRLGIPVLVTQLGVIVVSFADTMMIGRYGTNQLAAAAFVNSLFLVVAVMQIGFAAGITPLVGALFSQKDFESCGVCLKTGITVNTCVSLAFTLIMGVLYFFLDRMGQPEELLPLIRPYYLIVLASLLPMAIFNTCQQTANGSTDTAMPMWIMLGGNFLNIIGNWLLIYGNCGMPEMGLEGAGLSTLFCRATMAAAIIAVFFNSKRYRPYLKGFAKKPDPAWIKKVWVTSYPVMVQSGVECSLWSLGAVVCGEFGTIQLAGYQIVVTISQLGFMIYMSFSTATAIRVANFMGLRSLSGIRLATRAGLHICLALGTLSSVIFIVFSHQLIHLFTTDAAVVASAIALIVPLVIYQYGDAIQLTYANALRGMSDVKPLLWISLISYLGVGTSMLYLMAKGLAMQNVGVYYSFSFALFTASLLLWLSYRRSLRCHACAIGPER